MNVVERLSFSSLFCMWGSSPSSLDTALKGKKIKTLLSTASQVKNGPEASAFGSGSLAGFSVQLDPIGGKRETPAVWKDLQPCSGGKSPTLRRATRTCNLVRVAKARLCGGRSGRCNTPTLRRARSKQHLISNGLVKWNTQREETDLWEVSNLRSARTSTVQ